MVSWLREYKIWRDKEVKRDDDKKGYNVGAFRVSDEVKYNLLKQIMSLGILLSWRVKESR